VTTNVFAAAVAHQGGQLLLCRVQVHGHEEMAGATGDSGVVDNQLVHAWERLDDGHANN
jgi:hypothetical protein